MTLADPTREKSAAMMATPDKWPEWPFLPLARPTADGLELGLMWDGFHARDLTGYSATVFRVNLFDAYAFSDMESFLAQQRETFDSADELLDAGWRVD